MLRFGVNQLTTLPESIEQLVNLTELHVDGNPRLTLSEALSQLPNLQSLDLRENQLTTLPPAVCRLTSRQGLTQVPARPVRKSYILPDALSNLRLCEIVNKTIGEHGC